MGICIFAHRAGGYYDSGLKRLLHCSIFQDTRPKIFDTSLTLISRMCQRGCQYRFCLHKPPIQSLVKDLTIQPCIY